LFLKEWDIRGTWSSPTGQSSKRKQTIVRELQAPQQWRIMTETEKKGTGASCSPGLEFFIKKAGRRRSVELPSRTG
jgi:hypothetical protein